MSAGRKRPAEARLPLLSPYIAELPAQSTESWRAAWHLPAPLLYVFLVTVSLGVVYITLNCNSLNRRPNCFFICVCTNFYINALHLPYNLDMSLQSKGHTAAKLWRLRPTLRDSSGDSLRARTLHERFGRLWPLTAPSLSWTRILARQWPPGRWHSREQ